MSDKGENDDTMYADPFHPSLSPQTDSLRRCTFQPHPLHLAHQQLVILTLPWLHDVVYHQALFAAGTAMISRYFSPPGEHALRSHDLINKADFDRPFFSAPLARLSLTLLEVNFDRLSNRPLPHQVHVGQ